MEHQPSLYDTTPQKPVSTSLTRRAGKQRADQAPYAKGSKTSQAGAKKVKSAVGRQCQELLKLYELHGALTDMEAAKLMGVERTTVIPRRHALINAGKVEQKGTRTNTQSGVENVTYGIR